MFNVNLDPWSPLYAADGPYMDDTIKLARLRLLAEAGALSTATVIGRKSGWTVRVDVEDGARMLCSVDGTLRIFSTTDSAIAQMARLGVTRLSVIADAYEAGTLRAPRPDRALALKETAEYADWLKAKVEKSMARVASGESRLYPLDEARSRVAELLEGMEARKKRSP
jgi:hypothetical protein